MSEIRTLIVDDSSVMRKIVERALRQAGLDPWWCYEAGSGTEGLDVLKAKQVDLILSDINMPSMDGLEFLRQIRAQNLAPGVPVVMITTESSEEHVKQAIQAGAQGYIRKPFTAEQVKERVLPLVECGVAGRRMCAVEWSAGGRDRMASEQAALTKWSVRWRYRCVNPCSWSPIRGTWMRAWKRSFKLMLGVSCRRDSSPSRSGSRSRSPRWWASAVC